MDKKMKYRVIIKVSYYEAWFDFEDSDRACNFAAIALGHMVSNEDTKKKATLNLQIIDVEAEEKEEQEED